MPGFVHWPLEAAFRQIAEAGVDRVICLEEDHMILERAPAYWRALASGETPAPVTRVEVADFEVPSDEAAFLSLAREVADDLRRGQRILVHCAGGCGRTGTFAVLVLGVLGMDHADALATFRAARGCGPESRIQHELLARAAHRPDDAP